MKPHPVTFEHKTYEDEYGSEIVELRIVVGREKRNLGLGLQGFSEKDREWLTQVISRNVNEAYIIGFTEGRDMVRNAISDALGLAR